MQFWLIEDGEKSGPLEDYEIRELIRKGEVSSDRKIWHEGADGWISAGEVAVLKSEFERKFEPPPIPEKLKAKPPFLYWRRFGARWFDFLLYSLILFTVYRLGGIKLLPDPKEPISMGKVFVEVLPFIIMEAALLGSLGYTPGKWFMSLKVTNAEGKLLSTGAAVMRSLRIWVLGMGMNQPLLWPIAHLIAVWMGKKKGAPLWDLPLGHQVTGKTPLPNRLMLFFVLLIAIFVLIGVMVWPEFKPHFDEAYQEALRQQQAK